MDFENCKCAGQFPFAQPQKCFSSSNSKCKPLYLFCFDVLATGRIELTIRISVVMQHLNFLFLIGYT